MAKLKQETIAAQIGNRKCERTGAVNMPVYFSTAYQHADLGVSTGYDYTRTGNPTRDALQEALAELENGTHAFATSSGMSAIQLVFQLFKTGEHIISSQDLYGGLLDILNSLVRNIILDFRIGTGRRLLIWRN